MGRWTWAWDYSWVIRRLKKYNAIYLSGDLADNEILIQYVKQGGSVLIIGKSVADLEMENTKWGKFLKSFGLKFDETINPENTIITDFVYQRK